MIFELQKDVVRLSWIKVKNKLFVIRTIIKKSKDNVIYVKGIICILHGVSLLPVFNLRQHTQKNKNKNEMTDEKHKSQQSHREQEGLFNRYTLKRNCKLKVNMHGSDDSKNKLGKCLDQFAFN